TMQLPLISIIIPVYMVESYIEQCIQSVQKQTYKRLEVLIVDDGSPDKSIEKAKAITQGDDRFIYLQKKNSGLADARNMGLDHATGEYITF
ncbi:glycosyltransferase family 2 protein, partial [Streptococcus suis]|uniref:glycosyltransferase family 2 protein n=1 Tax=Streptococcus suis TaxID=1307 RepID=UPI001290434F